MEKKVTYIKRCLNCGNDEERIARDTNINSDLSDQDIWGLISNQHGNRDDFDHCENCKLYTRQRVVAYRI